MRCYFFIIFYKQFLFYLEQAGSELAKVCVLHSGTHLNTKKKKYLRHEWELMQLCENLECNFMLGEKRETFHDQKPTNVSKQNIKPLL